MGASGDALEQEDGYERRRKEIAKRILDAAAALIRSRGDTQFKMTEVAERAGVSQATPFNHFGSKHRMLFALLERSLALVRDPADNEEIDGSDPVEATVNGAVRAARVYISDAKLYRPILKHLLPYPPRHVLEEATSMWLIGLRAGKGTGQIDRSIKTTRLAELLETSWHGALSLWAVGEIESDELETRVEETTALILKGAAPSPKAARRKRRG